LLRAVVVLLSAAKANEQCELIDPGSVALTRSPREEVIAKEGNTNEN